MPDSSDTVSIGDFSRMTQLSVKTLRHYHDIGLMAPSHVDPGTGYRYYSYDQLPTAAVVRRLRALDMSIADVKAVLAADPAGRNALIGTHLQRLEAQLADTRAAVDALRDILDPPRGAWKLEHRSVPTTAAVAVHDNVDRDDLPTWWEGAVAELQATVRTQHLTQTGPPGALFGFGIFDRDHGPATVFIPATGPVRPVGRVAEYTVPAAELLVVRHDGPHDDVDLAYTELGSYATRHEISVDGPLREYYERFAWDTPDPAQWRTDLCWPIFRSDRGGRR
ncbi:MerR family transcriptional regulator [Mycolicibacterium fluoranthenivorans]|jgi:DNA-binding transcriptional MerR regulator|uniref:MerR family transcriptional regulator n=1 Tax=Mycolicibacterium fluoranthenivorans TaxID=258505 RepID=A0A7G8PMP4_9MYCO|nr:MerR family transcriptional regulator [Mycolicibacterium fluoranthenivorans]QNJ95610.1 MerR family transcriptional regulator [Mycolicibacterium fluoranthenivorans]